ncbi:serine hydrolase domain-containing protein [Thaumasiovibrio subtropicus]|uniref:serine hydrolase domain-containing protein n=1 Tax=Thaumasiovibrio subtropicus TaxID=1891207 RepID=UPI000B35A975|nr:serine hydrolase [Thaumasiovibrio subtropicus]
MPFQTGFAMSRLSVLFRTLTIFSLCCALAGCNTTQQTDVTSKDWQPNVATDWPVDTADRVGFDPAQLDTLVQDIANNRYGNTHAVLIAHKGKLVFERYFSGSDQRWGRDIGQRYFDLNSLHDVRSISKSVTSLLVGQAFQDEITQHGVDHFVATPLNTFLPWIQFDNDKLDITLEHTLTMTTGLQWYEMTEPYTSGKNDEIRLYRQRDPAQFVVSRPVVYFPGRMWYYSGGTTQVLASIISEKTGKTIDEYAEEVLFGPLGITNYEWLGSNTWKPNNPAAASGLRLTARDLTKLGQLFLDDGQWLGQQVIDPEWLAASSQRTVSHVGDWSDNGMWGYGYQWWIGDTDLAQTPQKQRIIAGVGNGNQRLYILPDHELVVTIYAGDYNAFSQHSQDILFKILAAKSSPE